MKNLTKACRDIFPAVEDLFTIQEIDGGINIISRDNGETLATLNEIEDGEKIIFNKEYLEWALPLECWVLIPDLIRVLR